MRAFIAVDFPASFAESIEDVESNFDFPGIKLVRPELVHITMKFLGEVDESGVSRICTALSQVSFSPFEAELLGVGVFPKPDRIKVIWLGVKGNFDALQREVDKVLSGFGFASSNDFTAHATIARVKRIDSKKERQLKEKVSSLADITLGSFTVDSLRVKKSTLTAKGPIYETVCEILLNCTTSLCRK
ncbi:MAG: RNA 2',3'-cyclic phosphodiesterase [Candidatus Argoarchaeum ethanivorans]|uniref:RNA 2',3'-cyclic phosphodiesterase n=1 Tax=Candidatus Argoarchaeum ethanivorans TaxID=2608793 RepID=A0A811TDB3_9EURY|nr:MAG: RNA 2',3'-cyclic phosphodiesterase [Candidatus Argoarchaeum ethanivorans]CAD6493662.1 MAG: RNA 2',3'-cyclic phosphodiesterase [Candidatus Argoarchaeum ethanivorans]